MRSGLGHRIIWYMVISILEVHPESMFTGHLKMEVVWVRPGRLEF